MTHELPYSQTPVIVWLRAGDLRLADNPALHHVGGRAAEARPVIPVFIWDGKGADAAHSEWGCGAASRWWLHENLARLDEQLQSRGSRLILKKASGSVEDELLRLVEEAGATAVYWNGGHLSRLAGAELQLWQALEQRGISGTSFEQNRIFSPGSIFTAAQKPYQVFTPFYKACLNQLAESDTGGSGLLECLPAPQSLPAPRDSCGRETWPASLCLAELGLLPERDWYSGMAEIWQPGEAGAEAALQLFLSERGAAQYPEQRDYPALRGTSRLSPCLHFGNITARQVWQACRDWQNAANVARSHTPAAPAGWKQDAGHPSADSKGVESFLRQLIWREFTHHLLYHFPHTAQEPLREEFSRFPWAQPLGSGDSPELLAWKRGQTGYPIVDAAMRDLWHTGWMHNRCRMIVASFLTKHLLLPWQEGAAWFWDTLVDADLANNTLGWQWTAGCGADAAPYFRIFNPVLQSEKFDARGQYIRHWCPELAGLPHSLIHAPWQASPLDLASAGITLVDSLKDADKWPAHRVGPLPEPGTYPRPIVDHAFARDRALAAYAKIRGAK